MSSLIGTYQQIFAMIYQAVITMLTNPLAMLRFFIPVLAILITSFAARFLQKRQKIDLLPTFEKKRELFRLPHDRLNLEVTKVVNEDYSDVVYRIGEDFQDAHARVQEFKRLIRRYRRAESRMTSGFKRLRERSVVRRRELLESLIELHRGLGAGYKRRQ